MQNLSLWSSGMCRKQNFEDTFCFLFIASYYVFFRWTFSRLYFGTLGGSLRIRWKERVWVVKQDFHASFQGNVTFFCCCFFFAIFSQLLDWIVLIIGSPVIISVFSHLCRRTNTKGGKTQGLWPRDNVLMTCFIWFSLAQICFVPCPLTPF